MRKYTWTPSLPDFRDKPFTLTAATLPTKVDLRPHCPPVYDQGDIGSCTANAAGAAFEFDLKKQGLTDFTPSRLFIYYNERVMDKTGARNDAGSFLRTAAKVLNQIGVCHETLWPYTTPFYYKPSKKCYAEAPKHVSTEYHNIADGDLNSMKVCLAAGFPFVFGFSVYTSFETAEVARTGFMPMPQDTEGSLGGHAVMAVGYDDTIKCVIVRNSWGTGWGDGGYFYMPYDYISNPKLASDFWKITAVLG